jgi:hypothetical protein
VKANLTGDVAELIEATGPHSHGRSRSHHARVVASSNKGGQAIPQEQSTGDAGDVCACEDGGKGPDSDLPRPDASLLNTQPSAGLPSGNGASLAVIPAPSPTSDSSGGMGAIRRSHQAARLVQSLRQQVRLGAAVVQVVEYGIVWHKVGPNEHTMVRWCDPLCAASVHCFTLPVLLLLPVPAGCTAPRRHCQRGRL